LFGQGKEGMALFTLFIGAFAGMLPDGLQFFYHRFKLFPFLQRFHMWIHAVGDLDDRPLIGIPAQILVIVIAAVIVSLV
jgi:hypothetical protein